MDEDYQSLKGHKDQVQQQKWLVFGEKMALRQTLKELVVDVEDLNHILSRSQQQIVNVTGGRHQQEYGNSGQRSHKKLTMQEMLTLIRDRRKEIGRRVECMIDGVSDMAKQLETQEDRVMQMERQIKYSHDTDPQQERYIEDLESQLKETRTQLLDTKLKFSDKDTENASLRKQLQAMSQNFSQLEDSKRELDQLVIKVSQELKHKEYDMRDFNYQLAQEKETVQRQCDMMKKELQEEKDRKENLEMLEGDLIHKLTSREHECNDLRSYIDEVEEKLQVKTEAIEKAQKVIQRLNEEMDRTGGVIGKVEQERDALRTECRDNSKRIVELNKQLQNQQAQHQQQHSQISTQLKSEVEALKQALASYQSDFDTEKRQLLDSLRDVNEQKYQLSIDKEKSDTTYKKNNSQLQDKLASVQQENVTLVKKCALLDKDLKERIDRHALELQQQEQSTQSQIKSLQRRLKEVSGQERVSPPGVSMNSYLRSVKGELDKVCQELLDIRSIIKGQAGEQSSELVIKMKGFEDFRGKVLTQLEEWESKANDIAQLSQKYQNELDEQRKLFLQFRQLVKEKDILIGTLNKQLKMKDQTLVNHMNTINKELERQQYLIRSELLEQIKTQDSKIQLLHKENHELELRFQNFKHEYAKLLDERESLKSSNFKLESRSELLNKDYTSLESEYFDFLDKFKLLLSCFSTYTRPQPLDLLNDLEGLLDELRVRRDENLSYKQQINSQQQHIDQEKTFMQSKIQSVESQIDQIQRQSMTKEEELQVEFSQKETKYMNDLQRMSAEMNSMQSQLQTRERQVKKLQEKADQYVSKMESLESALDQAESNKARLTSELSDKESFIRELNEQSEKVSQDVQSKLRIIAAMDDERRKQEEKEKYLKDGLYDKDCELNRERDLNLALQDEKYQAITRYDSEKEKSDALERESSNLYKELIMHKQTIKDITMAFEDIERGKYELQMSYNQMTEVMNQAQREIAQSQQAIESLNRALEKSKQKEQKVSEMKQLIKKHRINDKQMQAVIDDLRCQLNPMKANAEVQTGESGMQEILYMRDEVSRNTKQVMSFQRECESLRDALSRQGLEIDRLIEEKRDLEDLVDQQNHSIKQIRLNHNFKENVNTLNSPPTKLESAHSTDLMQRILQEKENYILRLESEISEMRKDIEQLQEKLIAFEIGNLSMDKSFGGGMRQSQHGSLRQKPILKGTYQSLNMSNLYNQTPTTNYGTIQILPDEQKHMTKSFYY